MLRTSVLISTLSLLALSGCGHCPKPAPCPTTAAVTTTPEATGAQATSSGYNKPPQHVLDVLHAPSPPSPYINPTRDKILLVSWVEYPPITQVAEPFLKLAGVRIEPRTRRKHDTPYGYGVAPCAESFTLLDIATSRETPIELPEGGCAEAINWSADGKRFTFWNTSEKAVELWLGEADSGVVRRLGAARLNPMFGNTVQWMPDQKTLLVKLVPDNLGAPPAKSLVADGPRIEEALGKSGESSTYETRDTLKGKHDEALFEYYGTSQLALVDSASGAITPIGESAVFDRVDAAPDGKHILVTKVVRPYSYVTTYDNFAHEVEIWDRTGKLVHTLAHLPVADRVPIRGVPTGPRSFQWRPTEPATLVWAEALDGGDPNVKAPARDKLMTQAAPFGDSPRELLRTEQRYGGIYWGERPTTSLLVDYDVNRHWMRTFIVNFDAPKIEPDILWDMSAEEKYKDPGNPIYHVMPNGQWAMLQDGDAIFLRGRGASPEGDRPFLDRLDLETRKTERWFRCDKESLEYFLAFTDLEKGSFLTWHQSPTDPPNAMLRTLGDPLPNPPAGEATRAATIRPVTHIPDPTPVVRKIKKRLVKYKRSDGMELSFTLYTPPDYQEGTRVPAILYAYPLDYANAGAAGQITGSEKSFTQLRDYRLLLLSGYAIIDRAAFPIVGDPQRAYDNYLEQLLDNARAAVDKAVELGVVDPDRIGVTGHSHGALMTANLVAHTDLFRAGVATSGSYNKTLTPFGFQNERRSVWKAQSVYLEASPFFFADQMKAPLLLIHGEDDANPGTTPLQSVKMYQAIRGNGGIARLVMLPHEPHWYSAMESNEQLAYEELRWFDKYVKNAPPREKNAEASPAK